MTMFKMSPTEIRTNVISCIEVGLVPFITSSPGLGKSAIVKQIAKDFNLVLIDLRLSQCSPEDLMGLPMRTESGRAKFASFEMFPTVNDKVPAGKNGWLLFLDEFNSARPAVQAAAYKLVLDKMVGQEELHPSVFCVAAGNLATDRAIVNSMSTAMQSRLIHLEMEQSHKDFMTNAFNQKFDHRVIGFLEFQPAKLHTFKPDHADKTFACPRTWEFVSRLIEGKPGSSISTGLIAGAISDGPAVEFMTFLKEYENLPTYGQICAAPEQTPIPPETGTRYALVTLMLSKFSKESFEDAMKYVARMPPEIQVIYLRGVFRLDPKMRRDPIYIKASLKFTRFLSDDDEFDQQTAA